jgi:phosphoribosylamine--glycine ligase/phosphoribosylformylglycinamidine cyclo-ligase
VVIPKHRLFYLFFTEDTDLADVMVACTEHWLDGVTIKTKPKFAATVVVAADGYPGSYAKGEISLSILPPPILQSSMRAQHFSTTNLKPQVVALLLQRPLADTLEDAVKKSYVGISTIHFHGCIIARTLRTGLLRQRIRRSPRWPNPSRTPQLVFSIDASNASLTSSKPTSPGLAAQAPTPTIGGFGGAFSLSTCNSGFHPSSPTLIGTIDGVGTKLKIAHEMGVHNTVGIDLVAMNVNDLCCSGCRTPLLP